MSATRARKSQTLRVPKATAESRAKHEAYAARLVPVTYTVVAGPPGCPETVTFLEDPTHRAKNGGPR